MRLSKLETAAVLVLVGWTVVVFFQSWETVYLREFSPDTLEIKREREQILFGVSFRSRREITRNQLLEYAIAQGYAVPTPTTAPRWISIYRVQAGSRGSGGFLSKALERQQAETIEWCETHPDLARVYWRTGLALLRSNDADDRRLGESFLYGRRSFESLEDMQQWLSNLDPTTHVVGLDGGRRRIRAN